MGKKRKKRQIGLKAKNASVQQTKQFSVKRQPIEWEEILANSVKGLTFI